MSTATDRRVPDDATVDDAASPPGGRPGRDALAEMRHPHRARAVKDVVARIVMWCAFVIAVVPLVWILWTVIAKGAHMLASSTWWTGNQRNINSDDVGGGARHAIEGTLQMVGVTALIAVPIGILTAVYLVEYGRGALARVDQLHRRHPLRHPVDRRGPVHLRGLGDDLRHRAAPASPRRSRSCCS